MQEGMQGAASIVGHENLHLRLGKIFDVFVERACLPIFPFNSAIGLLVLLVAEQPPALHGHASSRHTVFGGSAEEVA